MFRLAIVFLAAAAVAAILGFTGLVAGAASIVKFLSLFFLAFFVVLLVAAVSRRRKSLVEERAESREEM